ncbi:MAG TPA: hypothetical protein VHY37_07115 [Tepidisphaeraceae bacterium]|jgi:hypothetical protein|nr:hypothetical protein [Tepidisphaeraceae bacterium]
MTGRPREARAILATSFCTAIALLISAILTGCAAPQASDPSVGFAENLPGLCESAYVPSVVATCPVPIGWQAQPLKANSRHTHEIWISPSGSTAYGVVHFKLPLPVGPDLALGGFMSAMAKSEGNAQLLHQDANRRGIAFVADGGRYHMRAELITGGWEAWAIYAATLRGKPVVPAELKLAELAVAHTRIRDVEPPIRQARAGEE